MRAISTIELKVLMNELKELEGYFIEKFYEVDKLSFRFKIRKNRNNLNLICAPPYTLNLTDYIKTTERPTNFAIAVRKRIEGFIIESISQFNEDRIIIITLARHDEKVNLIIEMFGKGNFILADKEMKMLLVYSKQSYSDREIKQGIQYKPPDNNLIKLTESSKEKIKSHLMKLKNEDITILDALSKTINLGTIYLENIVINDGFKKEDPIGKLSEDKIDKISNEVQKLVSNDEYEFHVYKKEGSTFEYSIVKLAKYSKNESENIESLQKALDLVYADQESSKHVETESQKENTKETKKLVESIKKQTEYLSKMDDEIALTREIGDYIFKNMNEINKILNTTRENKQAKEEDIQKSAKIKISKINRKDRKIGIEV